MNNISGVAVDFGGTKIAAARYVAGELVEEHIIATEGDASSDTQIESILALLNKLHTTCEDSVGVAVSGRVDSDGNWFAVNKETLSDVHCVALKSTLEKALGQPVRVLNDAVAAGLAEAQYGAGQGVSAFAYITVSTGVGGVCVLEGMPVVSANGLAGHLGFVTSRGAVRHCGSGRVGTVESVASGRAMERSAEELTSNWRSARDVMEAFRDAEPWAIGLVNTAAMAIAELGANLAAVLGIEKVVLGGSVGLSAGYLEAVVHCVENEPTLFRIPVEKALLGHRTVLVGALCEQGLRL